MLASGCRDGKRQKDAYGNPVESAASFQAVFVPGVAILQLMLAPRRHQDHPQAWPTYQLEPVLPVELVGWWSRD